MPTTSSGTMSAPSRFQPKRTNGSPAATGLGEPGPAAPRRSRDAARSPCAENDREDQRDHGVDRPVHRSEPAPDAGHGARDHAPAVDREDEVGKHPADEQDRGQGRAKGGRRAEHGKAPEGGCGLPIECPPRGAGRSGPNRPESPGISGPSHRRTLPSDVTRSAATVPRRPAMQPHDPSPPSNPFRDDHADPFAADRPTTPSPWARPAETGTEPRFDAVGWGQPTQPVQRAQSDGGGRRAVGTVVAAALLSAALATGSTLAIVGIVHPGSGSPAATAATPNAAVTTTGGTTTLQHEDITDVVAAARDSVVTLTSRITGGARAVRRHGDRDRNRDHPDRRRLRPDEPPCRRGLGVADRDAGRRDRVPGDGRQDVGHPGPRPREDRRDRPEAGDDRRLGRGSRSARRRSRSAARSGPTPRP